MTQVKNLKDLPTLSKLGTTNSLLATENATGKSYRMSAADLKKELGSISIDDVMDNVFIMCHRSSDGYPVCYRPSEWAVQEAAGDVATGVLLIDGGRKLVIAPQEKTSTWSTCQVVCGTASSDRLAVQELYNGKENCAKILTNTTLAAEGDASAVGWCNAYERINAGGKGLKAGAWWLPSLGELYLIFANYTKINYALSKISGATLLSKQPYWSCTEYTAQNAWALTFNNGTQSNLTSKPVGQYKVRPVSAFASAT